MFNDQVFMDMLQNKELIIKTIMEDMEKSERNAAAFGKLEQLYADGKSVNTGKALEACAKSLRHSNEVNRRLLMILLVYVQGDNFTGDSANALMKMGRGKDALREMFRQKMGGS